MKKKVSKAKSAKKPAAKKTRRKSTPARRKTKVTKKPVSTKKAPFLWRFRATTKSALGIYIDASHCWVGCEDGHVYALTHDGQIARHYVLPAGVKSLVKDERWLYAGSNDGRVYDLRADRPYLAYEIDSKHKIQWMELFRGNLAISDEVGKLTVMDFEGEQMWQRQGDYSSGWLIRCDEDGLYHGPDDRIIKYSWKGKRLWTKAAKGSINFGWQEAKEVHAGTTDGVDVLDKKTGNRKRFCASDTVFANTASPDGDQIFAGGLDLLVAFDRKGEETWRFKSGSGDPLSMQYFDEKLYMVTDHGYLVCMDVSEQAIERAHQGKPPKTTELKPAVKKSAAISVDRALQTATASEGVVVQCYLKGKQLRVRPVSAGYKKSWHVQFPKNLREEGAQFVVESLVEATQGGFYRALGKISRLKE